MDTRRASAREFSSRVADELGYRWMGTRLGLGNPPIVLTSLIHVFGLELDNERIVQSLGERMDRRRPTFPATMSVAVLFATHLHTFEATLWRR